MRLVLFVFLLGVNSSYANVPYNQYLQDMLKEVILEEEDITTSDGIISDMQCGPYYDGISCSVEFTFFDERDVYKCKEIYTYRGGKEYWILDSNCWFREL